MPDEPNRVTYHYIKSNHFRVAHADGVWGGVTPHGTIHANFYSERGPIPSRIVHEIRDGSIGPEVIEEREVKSGPVREVEVGVVMDLATAKAFRDWLDEKIQGLQQALEEEEIPPEIEAP